MPSPPQTIRRKLVDLYKLRLKAISTETTLPDGFTYQTDLGARPIERWPTALQFKDDLPAIGIFDLVNKKVQEYPREKAVLNTLPVQIRIFLKRETDASEVDAYIGDVMRAVITDHVTGLENATLGTGVNALAVDMKPDEDGFLVPSDSFQIDAAVVSFMAEFLSKPFSAYE